MDKTYLYIAHPGHELMLLHWVSENKPEVNILTDGSGAGGVSRLESSSRVLKSLGIERGGIFGRFTDAEIYACIINRDIEIFLSLVDEIINKWRHDRPSCVVVDGIEGYNPTHDLMNLLVSCACDRYTKQTSHNIPLYSFKLVNKSTPGDGSIEIHLTDEQLEQKKEIAFNYPEMRSEVDMAIARLGTEECFTECLDAIEYDRGEEFREGELPFYELYGEKKVQEGVYDRVLRQKDMEEIWKAVSGINQ
jgi:hypothetical protein